MSVVSIGLDLAKSVFQVTASMPPVAPCCGAGSSRRDLPHSCEAAALPYRRWRRAPAPTIGRGS